MLLAAHDAAAPPQVLPSEGTQVRDCSTPGDSAASVRARGLFSTRAFKEGEVVFEDAPAWAAQSLENRQAVLTCGRCLRPLGSIEEHLGLVSGECGRATLAAAKPKMISGATGGAGGGGGGGGWRVCCDRGCGELYCSEVCRLADWTAGGHDLLCTGDIPEEEAEGHPLIQFKLHAMMTNEIFILVAKVVASTAKAFLAATAQSKSQSASVLDDPVDRWAAAIAPLQHFQQAPWWDCAKVPVDQDPEEFRATLRRLVVESAELLRQALSPRLGLQLLLLNACMMNHSCAPNTKTLYRVAPGVGLVAHVVALSDICEGDELVHSYIEAEDDLEGRREALVDYGFVCQCSRCKEEEEEEEEEEAAAAATQGQGQGQGQCSCCKEEEETQEKVLHVKP
eukprot:g5060.t1